MELRPGYKLTDVGMIPGEWEVRTIGQAMRLVNGRAFKPSDWKHQGTPIIRIQNLNDPEGSFNYCNALIDEKHRVTPGDVLFAWSGTKGTSFGARIWDGPAGVLNQHIFKILSDAKKLTSFYSFLILQKVQDEIEKQAHGFKASFVHVKKSDLVKVPLPIPPLSEQRAISGALGDVDALVNALTRLIAKKRDLKQAAMQQLLTGQTRLSGFSGKWDSTVVGDGVSLLSGHHVLARYCNTQGDGIPYLTGPADFSGGKIQNTKFTTRPTTICGANDILVTVKGSGSGRLIVSDSNYCISRQLMAIRVPVWNSNFVYYSLLQNASRIKAVSTGLIPGLSRSDILDQVLPMPTVPEQSAIAGVLTDMDAETAALEQRLAKTRALKQGMMQELLTGRLRLV